jgi:hypothetical protein
VRRTNSTPGPKPTVTPAVKARLLDMLHAGLSLADSLLIVGISRAAFLRARNDDEEFGRGVKSAAAEGKLHHLKRVRDGAERWQASAWFLERKYGQEFGKRLQLQGDPARPLTIQGLRGVTPEEVTGHVPSNGRPSAQPQT